MLEGHRRDAMWGGGTHAVPQQVCSDWGLAGEVGGWAR